MKIISTARIDTTNLGDLVCSPALYFQHLSKVYEVKKPLPPSDITIFGGGAIETHVEMYHKERKGIKIAWGIGQGLAQRKPATRTTLSGFTLIGSRDHGTDGTEWVPCASCMSPLFDTEYPEIQDEVWYLNSHRPVPTGINNRVPFDEAIRYLASGRTVITNSYHGMYWATLLGKEVVLMDSKTDRSKFYQMKPTGLQECRDANLRFDEKVRKLLNG